MSQFISILETEFKKKEDRAIAAQQKAYMKGQFEYFGLHT